MAKSQFPTEAACVFNLRQKTKVQDVPSVFNDSVHVVLQGNYVMANESISYANLVPWQPN